VGFTGVGGGVVHGVVGDEDLSDRRLRPCNPDAGELLAGAQVERDQVDLARLGGTAAAIFTVAVVIGDDLATSSLDASVALGSIDTGNHDRDASVQAPYLLDVAQRPTLAFRSTSISALDDDGSYAIVGDVTIGDVTQALTPHVEFGGLESAPDGARHAGFEAAAELRRKDFGIGVDIPGAMLGDFVKIELDVQLIEPPSPDRS
jgi:polyisoprenoid-binding protein YceI